MNIFKLKELFLDLVFPKNCLACGQEGVYLCQNCFNKIDINKKLNCALCKNPTEFTRICYKCKDKTALKAVFIVADYNNEILQNLIHNLKYNYIEELSTILTKLIDKYFKNSELLNNFQFCSEDTVLVPVPLHKKRQLSRGYNQSELLADTFCLINGFKKVDILKRIKNTQSQVKLSRQERLHNLTKAFVYKPDQSIDINKKIIIIDDVLTTGSTLDECARVLANHGFSQIYGLVLAQRDS